MSRTAKRPLPLPEGVSMAIKNATFIVSGRRGSLEYTIPSLVKVELQGRSVCVSPAEDSQRASQLAGTLRAEVANCIVGIDKGHERQLILVGVGYRAQLQGGTLSLNIGYSHLVIYCAPEGVDLEVIDQTKIAVRGSNKQQVSQVAAKIRSYRPPEPYKGKGIRYFDELIKLRETKKK